MSRVQLALNVSNLDEAIDFYSKFFNVEPAKVRAGYANFAIDEPPLKLVLIENAPDAGSLNHLGVEVVLDRRGGRRGQPTSRRRGSPDVEEETTCCYAVQDKVWVDGVDGVPWEVYTVLSDSMTDDGIAGDGQCCTPELDEVDRRSPPTRTAAERRHTHDPSPALWRRLLAEYVGSGLLAAVVIGSGIAAPDPLASCARSRAARERGRDRSRALRAHRGVRSGVGRAFQSGRLARRRGDSRAVLEGRLSLLRCQVAGCTSGAVLANLMFSRARDHNLDAPPRDGGARSLRGGGDGGADVPHLRAGAKRAQLHHARRGRCLHRLGLLLHELHELRESRDRGRSDVLQHLCGHCAVVGTRIHRGRSWWADASLLRSIRALYPGVTGDGRIAGLRHTTARPVRGRSMSERPTERPEILFLCVHNAGRSQMAAAFAEEDRRRPRRRALRGLGARGSHSTPRWSKPCAKRDWTSQMKYPPNSPRRWDAART